MYLHVHPKHCQLLARRCELLPPSFKVFLVQHSPCWRDVLLQLLSTKHLPLLCLLPSTDHKAIMQYCYLTYDFLHPQGPIAPPSLFDQPTVPSAPCPPPPPPPPGPPPVFADDDSQPQAGGAAAQHSALFAQLNQGMDITKGDHTAFSRLCCYIQGHVHPIWFNTLRLIWNIS